jgi:hypothetical protein
LSPATLTAVCAFGTSEWCSSGCTSTLVLCLPTSTLSLPILERSLHRCNKFAGAVLIAAALACSLRQTTRPSASTIQRTDQCWAGKTRAQHSLLFTQTLTFSLSGHEDCVNSVCFDSQVIAPPRLLLLPLTCCLRRLLCSFRPHQTEHSKFGLDVAFHACLNKLCDAVDAVFKKKVSMG